ncbi:MAG: hypothetical protein ABMA13_05695 [Chthoniobacteraceae bacterium]
MFSNILLIFGVAALTMALRSFRSVVLQKLGALGVLATSFLIGWLMTGFWTVGVLCAASWLMLPWLEILTRVRRLTLPTDKKLRHKHPPNDEAFPALDALTEEVEGEGFVRADDTGWDWQDYAQFFRLFYKEAERTQAAICLIDQHDVAFYYLSLSSRGQDGRLWTTWNYPFSYSLKLAPEWRVNRVSGDQSFLELYENHREFLRRNGVIAADLAPFEPDLLPLEIQNDMRTQIAHNLAVGVLTQAGDGAVRYSWRGLMFVWVQFLRDLVRFS